jgi:hypothetical protein
MSTATAIRRRTKKGTAKLPKKRSKPAPQDRAPHAGPAARPQPTRSKGLPPDRDAARPKPKMRSGPPPVDLEVDPDVLEFIRAIDDYRAAHDRPFPSWSEVLYVLKRMGYRRER